MMFTVPNLLSIIRLGLALSLPLIAWYGKTGLFFMALVTALLTDAVDGWIARRFSQASPLGTKLDSWSDLTLSFTVPLSVWWLFPKVIYREIVFVGILIGSYITPTLIALIKYGRVPSYHTNLAKIAGVLTGITGMIMLLGGYALPFRVTSVLVLLEALEETAITILLPNWASNVHSLAHARRIKQLQASAMKQSETH